MQAEKIKDAPLLTKAALAQSAVEGVTKLVANMIDDMDEIASTLNGLLIYMDNATKAEIENIGVDKLETIKQNLRDMANGSE